MKRLARYFETSCYLFGAFGLFGMTACAYIDPSAVTYVVQAAAGIVIALGAVVGIYWRRAKKKLNDKMGVDLDKNKEVESDEV